MTKKIDTHATVAAGAPGFRDCEQCGQSFKVRLQASGRQQRYCSSRCRQRTHRAKGVDPVARRRDLEARWKVVAAFSFQRYLETIDDQELAQVARLVSSAENLFGLGVDPVAIDPVLPKPAAGVDGLKSAPVAARPEKQQAVRASDFGEVAGLRPTQEQAAIIEAFSSGENLIIEAGAGTGKTSTLKMAATLQPDKRGLYLAFNKAIATDARKSFPKTVECRTAHSMAYAAVGVTYKHRLGGRRLPANQVAERLGLSTFVAGEIRLDARAVARLVSDTVLRYCRSVDKNLHAGHVPYVPGIDAPAAQAALAAAVVPAAEFMWADIRNIDGVFWFSHDHYLKMWALSRPQLDFDFLLFDEAQDADPLLASIVQDQKGQLVAVGDACQAIYHWRGAVDAMSTWPAKHRLYLTESFRFGPAIADEANLWLSELDSPLRLTGAGGPSTIDTTANPNAILCRTNGKALSEAIRAMDSGTRVALVGGAASIKRLAEASLDLQSGRATSHPELVAFNSWEEVQEYAEHNAEASDLATLVKLIDNVGSREIISAATALTDERHASLVISTAHKAKGREWGSVGIAHDFTEPKVGDDGSPGAIRRADAMLAYVAVTRAKRQLDPGGLAWIHGRGSGKWHNPEW
ncbi:UvrD-helicase domain-containing protein [Natronoglycomyces albus]|uniref:UvrD-helicase domain-containing protein n=1 Tax=Natronoglycomyces albus TaxID=2811108 RepID=UPI001FE74FA9|nr:UvrD-helicase domain-containing protein [Natronoglycomyces albus]